MKGEKKVSSKSKNSTTKKKLNSKTKDLVQEKMIDPKDINLVKEKKVKSLRIYFSYNARLIICIIIFLALVLIGFNLFSKTINYVDLEDINYYEKSNLDYKVYLKENDFYENDYLDKDMLYVASIIDHIDLDFNYNFQIDKNIDLESTYKIIGKLVITDPSGKNTFFQKQYNLLNDKKININNKNFYEISEKLDIDYNYYNSLANRFKSSYGLDVKSNLIVYLKINNKNTNVEEVFSLNDNREMAIVIPLTERSITIQLNYNEINESNKVIKKSEYVLNNNIILLIQAILVLILSALMLFIIIKLLLVFNRKRSIYDKIVKKILNEYDRLVVETEFFPDLEKLTVIKINKFQELLDVRDNLKLPIMYYNVTSHHKCYFYIKDDNDLYLHTIKSIDLEGKYEKE
ncbi:MAG: hypothetical protein IJ501_00795 [Bacilli bacterium]|nr:hypothetical protein [Bacilli bacterium]